jgi:hypothetical protein
VGQLVRKEHKNFLSKSMALLEERALTALEKLAQEPFEGLDMCPSDAKLLARELFRFLSVRRDADAAAAARAAAAASAPASTSSPSTLSSPLAVDHLWHAMLLEHDVATVVHAALGCVVRHSARLSRQRERQAGPPPLHARGV